jgi:hypothetical protein
MPGLSSRFSRSIRAFQPIGQCFPAPSGARHAQFGKHDEKGDDSHDVQRGGVHDVFSFGPVIVFEFASLMERPHGVCHVLEWVSCPSVTLLRDMIESLTEREREICKSIVDGLPNHEIADRLGISHRAAQVHRRPRHAKDAGGDARGVDRGLP